MKDSKTIKEYTNKLIKVVNQIYMLGEELTEEKEQWKRCWLVCLKDLKQKSPLWKIQKILPS